MAEDRLDEAIDAVVRAVDRIERATRGIFEPTPEPPRTGPTVPSEPAPPPNDLGPPPAQQPAPAPQPEAAVPPAAAPRPAPAPPAFGEAPATSVTSEFAALAGERLAPAAATPHELIGHIVATTQQLEDHLAAARALRAELSDLVSRLAADTQPPPVL